ncbi:MAG: sigma-70 family RNA polymerase sigma factor [Lentisphaeraceae bacterium]|nr:sigma-70 family RNA polymerase sigma factor [Lentisphaeraceae bacterium]
MNKLEEFVENVDAIQGDLLGFILSLTGNYEQARDVLQETNLVIVKKLKSFELGTSFRAWAFTIARFQVMAFRKKVSRDKLVFSDNTFNDISADYEDFHKQEIESKYSLLDDCIDKLPDKQKQAVKRKYIQGQSLRDISTAIDSNENSISQILFRARKNLIECVDNTVSKNE